MRAVCALYDATQAARHEHRPARSSGHGLPQSHFPGDDVANPKTQKKIIKGHKKRSKESGGLENAEALA